MPEKVSQIVHLLSPLVRTEQYDGREHLVVPTILIVEGVHNNGLYRAEDLKRFPKGWNGRPVLVDHPELHGLPVSAADPKILERQSVGLLFNSKYDEWPDGTGTKRGIKSEAWIDVEKCRKVDSALLTRLQNGEPTEVSTGLYAGVVDANGQWNGESYREIKEKYVPDHLALLPDSKGACSWEDGAGMPRVNSDAMNDKLAERLDQLVTVLEKKFTGDKTMERKDRIDALLRAEKPAFVEADREMLTKLSDEHFDKIEAISTPKPPEKKVEKPVADDGKIVKMADYLATVPAEVREELAELQADRAVRCQRAIETLKASKRNPFSDEELASAPLKQLEGMVALIGHPADFSGQGGVGAGANRTKNIIGLEMPKVEYATGKAK